LSGEYKNAWNVLNIVPMPGDAVNEQFAYLPLHLMRAELSSLENNAAQARRYYDSARVHLEAKLRTNPGDERYHSALGLAYAGLGRRQEAIREGERAVQILPVTREAWKGSFRLVDLARIYAMAGEPEKAIDLLEQLLSMPSEISRPYLRIDPAWRYLRGNERFEALVRE
jgi:serine/threonine-protein kinase